ncbi:MAG: GntP family permease [Pirellulaceae bacterium]|nr:GntP family permease [Pirellulaceae bacterium]
MDHRPKHHVRQGIVLCLSVLLLSWVCTLVAAPIATTQSRQDSTIIVPSPRSEQPIAPADIAQQAPESDSDVEREVKPFLMTSAHVHSLLTLCVGVLIVLIGIIGLKLNAFLALIVAALVVSLMSAGEWSDKVTRVGSEFGGFAGRLGLVIALAAIIGQSFLASGCAERIVNVFVKVLGEKRTPFALCGSGYVVGIPVFFDTVFYLLVPLARSAYLKAKGRYLACLLAVVAGGTATHTMVPPTPGPLLVASNLGVNLGMMLMVGSVISLFAASAGMVYALLADRWIKVPVRWLEDQNTEPEAKHLHSVQELPPLWVAVLPIGLPVLLIAGTTVLTTLADQEETATFKLDQPAVWRPLVQFMEEPVDQVTEASLQGVADGGIETAGSGTGAPIDAHSVLAARRVHQHLLASLAKLPSEGGSVDDASTVARLNRLLRARDFYAEDVFFGVRQSAPTKKLLAADRQRMPLAQLQRLNRLLLEDSLGGVVPRHFWETSLRQAAMWTGLVGDPNIALLIAAVIALLIEKRQRRVGWGGLGEEIEKAMASAGVIILITAAGGAFGSMLTVARVGDTIRDVFSQYSQSGLGLLVLAFAVSSLIKIAQGSSTVAMITASGMVASMASPDVLGFHPVYMATAIGGGSLFGSWMNDSGFWIFTKMSYLTTEESLKTWTPCLAIVGLTGGIMSVVFAWLFPMV